MKSQTLFARIRRFFQSEDGPTAVEYAIMVALVAIGIITAVNTLAGGIQGTFTGVANNMPTGSGSGT